MQPEQPVRLDDFEALVHQGRRVDRDLLTHLPGWVLEGIGSRDVSKALTRPSAEGPAGGREDEATDLAGGAAVQALMDRVVLAVDGQDRHPVPARGLHHESAGHDQYFLVRERDCLAARDRREHRLERGRARGRA